MRRIIRRYLSEPLADYLLSHEPKAGLVIKAGVGKDGLAFAVGNVPVWRLYPRQLDHPQPRSAPHHPRHQGHGGGIYLYSSAAVLTNNVVSDNATSRDAALGAGMYVCSRSSPTLLHNTIARNKGKDGSGIYVDEWYGAYSSIAMTNTIISGHTTGIMVTTGNTATLTSTLWHDNTTDRGGAGVINHSDDHNGDPKFAFDGYHLLPGSTAIDKGVNAGVTKDIDGDARPYGSGYDIGADEFGGTVVQAQRLFLPLSLRKR